MTENTNRHDGHLVGVRGSGPFRVECSCGWASEDVPASIGAGVAWQAFDLHREEVDAAPATTGYRVLKGDRSTNVHDLAHRAGLAADRR